MEKLLKIDMDEIFQSMHIGTTNLDHKTCSTKAITEAIIKLYDKIIDDRLLVRRINLVANNVINEMQLEKNNNEQISIFMNYKQKNIEIQKEKTEKNLQKTVIEIKRKYGKNAIIKCMDLQEEGTTMERNKQIGGHKE